MPWNQDSSTLHLIVRVLGAFIGVIASLIMVAPKGTRAAFYRVLIGVSMGTIFAPVVGDIPMLGWLQGPELEHVMARAAFAGFTVWFCLEGVARVLSSTEWLERLAREILRLGGKGRE